MNQQQLMEALAIIAEEQATETGSVEIRIGQRRKNDGELYLLSCCSEIIDAIANASPTATIFFIDCPLPSCIHFQLLPHR